jgi:metal-responsive CopG/Arc/MetJ family transcriptional regulator
MTTVALSADLLGAVDAVVQEGAVDSRNDFLERAVRKQLQDSRRTAIDAEFARMAEDRTYREEAVEVEEAFAEADWEALRTAERSA